MSKILKLFGYLLLFVFFILAYVLIFSSGLVGKLPQDYEVIESPRPQIDDSASTNQIFFGDLHVHTTFSQVAFLFSLPVIQVKVLTLQRMLVILQDSVLLSIFFL